MPIVAEASKAQLERPLSNQEPLNAGSFGKVPVWSMEGGKSPGIDRLPVEFYKEFWSELGGDLVSVLNESLTEGYSTCL